MNALVAQAPCQSAAAGTIRRLPLVTLYLSERCNSRCVTCDYWRHGHADLDLAAVERLLPSFASLQTEVVLFSGGEALLNPQWPQIAELLRGRGLKLWLLTSGLSLAKHARRVTQLFDAVTVSLDGADAATYAAIRGIDAFEKVCEGIRAVTNGGSQLNIRVTVQKANYRQLPAFVEIARDTGARQVSFLAVDVANPQAFGRLTEFEAGLALEPQDLPEFEQVLDGMEARYAAEFRSGMIAESPGKLRRLLQYFRAIHGLGPPPPVRCNAPEFSAVIDATGRVRPCFFIPGPVGTPLAGEDLSEALNHTQMIRLRTDIRGGARPECVTCVCSIWRDVARSDTLMTPARQAVSPAEQV